MSADNTIAIMEFPDGFRVAHCQAVEDICDQPDFPNKLTDAYRRLIFDKCFAHEDAASVWEVACALEKEIEYVEYGIRWFKSERPFPAYGVEEANRIIDEYWVSREKETENYN